MTYHQRHLKCVAYSPQPRVITRQLLLSKHIKGVVMQSSCLAQEQVLKSYLCVKCAGSGRTRRAWLPTLLKCELLRSFASKKSLLKWQTSTFQFPSFRKLSSDSVYFTLKCLISLSHQITLDALSPWLSSKVFFLIACQQSEAMGHTLQSG